MGFQIRAKHLWDGEAEWSERPVVVSVEGERLRLVAGAGEEVPMDQKDRSAPEKPSCRPRLDEWDFVG